MKNIIIKLILTLTLIFTAAMAFAQGPPGPPATPIDGGLSLLLAAGGVYGIKKLRDARR